MPAAGCARAPAQGAAQLATSSVKGRSQSEQESGNCGKTKGKREHPAIDVNLF